MCFIFLSNGEDEQRDGQTFTSKSQGLNLLSIMISNPKISKKFDFLSSFLYFGAKISGYADIQVLMMTS